MNLDNLVKLRTSKKLSQKNLADMLHLAQSSVNQYEHGISEPDITTLKRMADIFNCSVDYIIGNTTCTVKIDDLITYTLTSEELGFIEKYRKLSPQMQRSLEHLIDTYLKENKAD